MTNFLDDPDIQVNLDQIQGNTLAGFNKDYETLLFLHFGEPSGAKQWLVEAVGNIATMREVLDF